MRAAVLAVLAEPPRHGYDLIREIEERSDRQWTPSPGSIFPTLQSLEDEGLVAFDTVDGRKTASLTVGGVEWMEGREQEAAAIFANAPVPARSARRIRAELAALTDASMHVARQ